MKSLILAVALIVSLPAVTLAQYTGPNTTHHPSSVSELKDNAGDLIKNKTIVSSLGFVVRQIEDHKFIFQDQSGSLELLIMPDNLPAVPFDDKDKVMIIGRMQDKKTPYLEVSKTIVLHLKKAAEHHEKIAEETVAPEVEQPEIEEVDEVEEDEAEMDEMEIEPADEESDEEETEEEKAE